MLPTRSVSKGSAGARSEEHTSELQSRLHLVCRLLLEKKTPISWAATRASPSRVTDQTAALDAAAPNTRDCAGVSRIIQARRPIQPHGQARSPAVTHAE